MKRGGTLNDRKLIIACQSGEKQAFSELIAAYYPYVSKFLLNLTMDEDVNEDIVQETFIKLIRSIDKFDVDGRATFATYLMTIARNCYLDYLRKNKHSFLNVEDEEIIDTVSLEDKVLDSIEIKELLKALETLPYEQSQAIRLKYMEQLTLKEIAERFHTEPKTIKSRLHDGLAKLRKKLNKGGNQNG
jgi:RNA polymerase sigma-70 factor (ECF subfamily)